MLRKQEPKSGLVFDSTNYRTEWTKACAAVGLGTLEDKKSEAGWKWQKYAGLKIHDLRRSAVRNLRLAGVAEDEAMKISGHKTRNVFDRYNIVSTEDVVAAMRKRQALVQPVHAPKPTRRAIASSRRSAKLVQTEQPKKRKLLTA